MVGSSPHTRGAHFLANYTVDEFGIIPAYAGSTFAHERLDWWSGDHPRIRGEHTDIAAQLKKMGGSSPHTRGAPIPHPSFSSGFGIIPAYAGSTSHRESPLGRSGDHPRIRGEHIPGEFASVIPWGSSPHTRGAPLVADAVSRLNGIIPAYAGSTPR